ncbi:FAD-binding protein [uncultured Sphaerochaeta sp.]|uniref:FAD-binding protein n=1 Tax=uncultured Sphaerochaeta sp. TaxID=886478 RepID=UPI002A0A8069|nr:FAD-binding protein [uncultured Sphaerochaeta sp.]
MDIVTDVLIIGAGTAGLRSAIAAADQGVSVLLISKLEIEKSGTTNADVAEMAGFNAAGAGNEYEIELHYQDMVNAGQNALDKDLAMIVAQNAPSAMKELQDWGVAFEEENGKLFTFQSCFSSYPRTHVIKGHGRQIAVSLRREVLKRKNISILTNATIIGLLRGDSQCVGAYGVLHGEKFTIHAKSTILASGGCGMAFKRSFSPSDVTGSAYEMAYSAGAVIQNIEFMQIGIGFSHPLINIFNGYLWQGHPILSDTHGNEIFSKVLPKGITPENVFDAHVWHFPFSSRDTSKYLEIAINRTIAQGLGSANGGVYVDMRHMNDAYIGKLSNDSGIAHMWPLAKNFLRTRGVDLLTQTAEVACFQHAMNGGIKIDQKSESTLSRLYAVGECAGGPHGADRLGGNMFVTSLVFGRIAGEQAAKKSKQISFLPEIDSASQEEREGKQMYLHKHLNVLPLLRELQERAQNSLLVDRTEGGLEQMLQFSEAVEDIVMSSPDGKTLETRNYDLMSIAKTTWLISKSALERKESRGSHHRSDYPKKNDKFNRIIEQVK